MSRHTLKNGDYLFALPPAHYPGKRYRDKYVYEHHLVWWEHTGQVVPSGMTIHHKDENKHNNDFNNLVLVPRDVHGKIHARCAQPKIRSCDHCLKTFESFKRGSVQRFCSRQCIGAYGFNSRERRLTGGGIDNTRSVVTREYAGLSPAPSAI